MFPFSELSDWFGVDFSPRFPDVVGRMRPHEVRRLAEYLHTMSASSNALPRSSRRGELRPNLSTMRTLDVFWGPGNLMDRLCAVLTYSHAATAFDPLSFTIEEWARSEDPDEWLDDLPETLSDAMRLLVRLQPLVEQEFLDLLPPRLTRDYGDSLPVLKIDDNLMAAYSNSGLNERIGDFNSELGGRHPSGRYRGYVHLWEILQDLTLANRFPDILQPLFIAGFDVELANLLTSATALPTARQFEALAAFQFPTLQMDPSKVVELRKLDAYHTWRESLQSALMSIDIAAQGVQNSQAQVSETLAPAAEKLMKTLKSGFWTNVRQTGVEKLVIGGCAGGSALMAGGNLTTTMASGLAGAAAGALWSGARAVRRPTGLDIPFMSLMPDIEGWQSPLAIPTMGLL